MNGFTGNLSDFRPIRTGERVTILAGWGGKGGMAGQDFRRFAANTPATVTDVVGSDVWVRPDDSPYKWRVQVRAIEVKA